MVACSSAGIGYGVVTVIIANGRQLAIGIWQLATTTAGGDGIPHSLPRRFVTATCHGVAATAAKPEVKDEAGSAAKTGVSGTRRTAHHFGGRAPGGLGRPPLSLAVYGCGEFPGLSVVEGSPLLRRRLVTTKPQAKTL